MALAPVSKMTNAMVEVGLISVSVVLGIIGLPYWVVALMVGVSLGWWAYVHRARFAGMFKAGPLGALGSLVLAISAMTIGHGFGYIIGLALHTIMRLK